MIYGQGWPEVLAKQISRLEDGRLVVRGIDFPCVNPLQLAWEVARANIVMRVGVRPAGGDKRMFVLDCLWQLFRMAWPRKEFIYYWIGTDVLEALEDKAQGRHSFFFEASRSARHLANAPWLQEELASLGLASEVVLFPSGIAEIPARDEIAWPERFAVMAYIPDHRHGFYGGDSFVEAAKRLPGVDFYVVAGEGGWLADKPKNLNFLGFQRDMKAVFNRVHVVVRQVRHDAIGGTVREALFYARHAIYSYPVPHTHFVAWGDAESLIARITHFQDLFEAGQLSPNEAGREYAASAWLPSRLTNTLVRTLLTPMGGEGPERVG